MNENVDAERKEFLTQNKYTIHLRSIEECKKEGLDQAAYFIEKEMLFLKEVNHIQN